jgi:hypothetical protein
VVILYSTLYKGGKFFLTIWTAWVSKDAEFYVDFKNIKLPWWQNAPKKKLFLKNMLKWDFS